MPLQTLQRDAQHDLARPRRPAHLFLGPFEPFQIAAAAQRHISQPRPQIAQRPDDPRARRLCIIAARPRRSPPLIHVAEKTVPVLRDPRAHLRQFEILAQPLTGAHQIIRQKTAAIPVAAPGQRDQRAFGQTIARAARQRRVGRVLAAQDDGRLAQAAGHVLGLGQHLPERRTSLAGDMIPRDAARLVAGDPALEGQRLGHLAIHHRRARRLPPSRFRAPPPPCPGPPTPPAARRSRTAAARRAAPRPSGAHCSACRSLRSSPDWSELSSYWPPWQENRHSLHDIHAAPDGAAPHPPTGRRGASQRPVSDAERSKHAALIAGPAPGSAYRFQYERDSATPPLAPMTAPSASLICSSPDHASPSPILINLRCPSHRNTLSTELSTT